MILLNIKKLMILKNKITDSLNKKEIFNKDEDEKTFENVNQINKSD